MTTYFRCVDCDRVFEEDELVTDEGAEYYDPDQDDGSGEAAPECPECGAHSFDMLEG